MIAINVSYDHELGLIVAPENGDEEDDDGDGDDGDKKKKKKSGKKKRAQSDILAILQKLNEHEDMKEEEIKEWKSYVLDLFDFFKQDTKLIAKINTPEHFTREQLQSEYKKALRKFLRKAKDPIKRSFLKKILSC